MESASLFALLPGFKERAVFEALFKDKLAPLILRLTLGGVYLAHGFGKIMANGGMSWYPGLAVGWQLAIAWGEFAAGLAMLLGFHCRAAAAVAMSITVGWLLCWHGWNVTHMPMRNLEPTLMLVMAGLTLVFLGAGQLSIDGRGAASTPTARAPRKK
jgi:putative oxidoreductase